MSEGLQPGRISGSSGDGVEAGTEMDAAYDLIHGLCPGSPIGADPAATCAVCNMSRLTLDAAAIALTARRDIENHPGWILPAPVGLYETGVADGFRRAVRMVKDVFREGYDTGFKQADPNRRVPRYPSYENAAWVMSDTRAALPKLDAAALALVEASRLPESVVAWLGEWWRKDVPAAPITKLEEQATDRILGLMDAHAESWLGNARELAAENARWIIARATVPLPSQEPVADGEGA